MKRKFNLLAAFLLVLCMGWAGAEEMTVKVGGDRSAVLHITDTESPDPDVSGTFKSAVDLKAGKSALTGDLMLKNAPELKDARGALYTQMTGASLEAIGFIDAKLPPDPEAPKVLDIKAETVTEGDQSAANFNINIAAPNNDSTVPSGSGEAKLDGDFKAMQSSGKFDLSGGDINADDVPFKGFTFQIVEAENKTTISFEMKVPKDSELVPQLEQLPTMAPMIEQQLKQANIQYEGLEFPAPTDEGDLKVATGKLTIVDLRGTIRPFLGLASGQLQAEMGPDVDVQGAFENMLDVRFDKLSVVINVEGDKLDGNFEMNLSQLDKFYNGYLTLLPALQKQSNRELVREAGEFAPLVAAFMELNSEQAAAAIRAAVDANMKLQGNLEFKLEPKEQEVSFTANGNLLTTNYGAYVAKAREAGLPVAEKAVGNLDLELKDGTHLVGDVYLYTDGELLQYYKGMLSKAAEQSAAPPDVVQAIEALELNQAALKVTLEGSKLILQGRSDTSDLTSLAKLILSQAAPQLNAQLTGASLDVQMPEGQETATEAKLFFTEFLPGQSEAQIKEALGLGANATVVMEAPAEEVRLVALEQPEIAVDGQLAEVQSEGQQLLASSPADLGGGGGGGTNWGLIALGVLVLVGVGGFLMFGKKS